MSEFIPKNLPFQLKHLSISAQDHIVHVTDDFLEFISEGVLAIEVWGHRCAGTGRSPWQLDVLQAKSRTLRDRSVEHTHASAY